MDDTNFKCVSGYKMLSHEQVLLRDDINSTAKENPCNVQYSLQKNSKKLKDSMQATPAGKSWKI